MKCAPKILPANLSIHPKILVSNHLSSLFTIFWLELSGWLSSNPFSIRSFLLAAPLNPGCDVIKRLLQVLLAAGHTRMVPSPIFHTTFPNLSVLLILFCTISRTTLQWCSPHRPPAIIHTTPLDLSSKLLILSFIRVSGSVGTNVFFI